PGVDADNFSVRWTGQLAVPYPGETYTFTTETDDGVRLWVNDTLVIDQWIDQGATLWSGPIYLDNFGPHDIKMEYYENGGGAVARLMWESASVPYGVIPSNYLAATSDEAKAAWTAYGPYPRDRGLILPDEDLEFKPILTWVPGLYASTHELYFSSDFDDVNDRTAPMIVVSDPYYTTGLLDMDQTYYWCIDESNGLGPVPGDWPGDVWSFTPVSSGYVTREWWLGIPGTLVTDLTNNARYPDDPDGSELITTFEGPTGMADDYGTRIHGWLRPRISGDYTFWIATDDNGELWLSTSEDPCDAVLISEVTDYADTRQWYDGDVIPSNPIALDGRRKYYISALMKEGGGGDNLAVAWRGPAQPNPPIAGDAGAIIDSRFLSATPYDPPYATNPSPADGATNVQDRMPALEWWPGCYAKYHRVYFSTDFDDVNDRTVSAVTLSDPCHPITTMLDLGRTYYWVVDEVNSTGPAPGLWPGRKVWSFTMSECLSIENVEDYNDRGELRNVWTDGKASVVWGGSYPYHFIVSGGSSGSNLNVSTEVGTYWNGAASSEPVPALPGAFNKQSLVLHYDNDGSTFTPYTYNPAEEKWVYPAPYYSEIEAETAGLEASQNWTSEGLKSLVMWYTGHSVSDGSYDGTDWPDYTMQARGSDIWGRRDEFFFLGKYPLRTALATVSVQVLSMDNTDPWAKAGVMIRENMTPYSKYAGVFITPSSGVTFQWRDATNAESQSTTKLVDRYGDPIMAPQYVRLMRRSTFEFVASHSSNGSTWYDVNAPGSSPMIPTILMGTTEDPCVYIGTALSSHNPDMTCTASFDNFYLSTIPTSWVNGNIGTNSAEQLYVALEDTMGNMAVIEHPDPEAAIQTDWQEWNIDLTEFGGVNMDAVKKVYIGLGDRAAPVQGGSGTIYI
ncbi:MAG: PA14 domain-containing protein, partial [Dehalococcoidia bacterium]|nr:PA14 domain-containing protein [Dehalococcoidia bacterium]